MQSRHDQAQSVRIMRLAAARLYIATDKLLTGISVVLGKVQ